MGALRFLALGFAVCMALASSVVEADELILPYTCTMDRGAPRLSPAEATTYPIIGSREDHAVHGVRFVRRLDVRNDDGSQVHDRVRRPARCLGEGRGAARALGVVMPAKLPPGYAPVSQASGPLRSSRVRKKDDDAAGGRRDPFSGCGYRAARATFRARGSALDYCGRSCCRSEGLGWSPRKWRA